jgi:hypothetical protein
MLDYPLADYLKLFTLLLMAVYSLYEIGYIYNDFIRVEYDEKPTIRPYVGIINARLATAIRITYIVLIGLLIKALLPSYIVAICILSIAILNHNLIRRKVEKIASWPYLRLSKYMFVPIAISNFNLEVVESCLLITFPLIVMDAENTIIAIIKKYEGIKISPLEKPYYVWFLTFLPIQLILLIAHSPLIFTGELLFIIISVVRHK